MLALLIVQIIGQCVCGARENIIQMSSFKFKVVYTYLISKGNARFIGVQLNV